MRMPKLNVMRIAGAVVAQGVGVYITDLIRSKTERGTASRWIWVSIPAVVGVVTPLAFELMDAYGLTQDQAGEDR